MEVEVVNDADSTNHQAPEGARLAHEEEGAELGKGTQHLPSEDPEKEGEKPDEADVPVLPAVQQEG